MSDKSNKTETGKSNFNIKIIFFSSAAAAVLVFIFVIVPVLRSWSYANEILPLPDLSGERAPVVKFLTEKHLQAVDDPTSENVGTYGMAFHANFFYDEAEKSYALAYDMESDNWKWYYYHSLIKEELGDTRAAIGLLISVLDINPGIVPAWFRLGNSYLKLNSFDEAEKAFEKAGELKEFSIKDEFGFELPNKGAFPYKAYAKLNLGRVKMQQDKPGEAKLILEKTIEEFPTFGQAYRLLGQIYNQTGEKEKGDEYLIIAGDFESFIPPADPVFDVLVLSSRNSDFILKEIDIATRSGNINWAVYLNRHIFEFDSRDGEALLRLIKLSLDVNRLNGLESLVDGYIEIYKNDENKLMMLAEYSIMRNQPKPAVKILTQALRVNPNSLPAHLEMIKILRSANQVDKGIEYCSNVILTHPKEPELRNEMGRLLILQGKFEAAKQQFNLALNYDAKNETALVMQALIAKEEGNINRALQYYKESVAANSRNVRTVVALVNYYLELRKWNEAVLLLEKKLKDFPNDSDLLERYAWISAVCPDDKIRDADKALKISKRLEINKKLGPDEDIKAGIVLAVSYASLGEFDKAVEICDEYLIRAQKFGTKNLGISLDYFKKMFAEKKAYTL